MPVSQSDICRLSVSKADILSCINKARHSAFIDNLRYRHPKIQFDSKLRGYIGELALTKWLNRFNLKPELTNYFDDVKNMDVDLLMTVEGLPQKIEIKTSLIPDKDKSINKALQNRDIKLIKRGNKSIAELESDVHIQVFFNQLAQKKDIWLTAQKIDFDRLNEEEIYFKIAAYRYTRDVFLWVGHTNKR